MMTGMAGRVRVGKRVHRIDRYRVPGRRGVARCGWAGAVTLVPEGVVTCAACARKERAASGPAPEKTEGAKNTETSGTGRPIPLEAGRA